MNKKRFDDLTEQSSFWFELALAGSLLVFILICRVVIEIPNFHPVMAVALFGGFAFSRKWLAIAVPICGMAATDLVFFGGYQWQIVLVVYTAMLFPLILGSRIRERQRNKGRLFSIWAIVANSLLSAFIFFFMTNAAWWYFSGLYEATFAGLTGCLAMGLPFLKWSLISNVLFGCGLFAAYECVCVALQLFRFNFVVSNTE